MSSRLARGSILILIGNVIFRIGGFIYRFLMAQLLGPSAYGILGYTLQFQGILQVLSAGGLPPAIAKYVAEYTALDKEVLARQTIYTSLKIMLLLGILFGFLMVFIIAPFLAQINPKMPGLIYPLQAVGFIVPFSVIVGAFRGAFQGVIKMEYILATRATEQIFMIIFATILVILGYSALGAVFGSVLGFAASAVLSVIIFQKYMWKYVPKPEIEYNFSFLEEVKLAKQIVVFAIPVTITALAEMCIFAISTFVIANVIGSVGTGYFNAADPISRFPLIISTSLATTILPAVSAAFGTKNQILLSKYVSQSYRYSMVIILPMTVGIALFAEPILQLTFPKFLAASPALSILVVGMTFYSLFAISSSIVQGIGNPRTPMYVLVVGAITTFILNWFIVPIYGIVGGALATTIACFLIMIPILKLSFNLTKTKAPYMFIGKAVFASLIMGIAILLIPKTTLGLLLGIIIGPIIYLIILTLSKAFDHSDFLAIRRFSHKFGPLSKIIDKILNFMEKLS
ncbi:putative cell division protein YtgP [Methanobrevibacter cuticularis]|uniref:Putative cell division protein YtgP n=1 Tax=Methanobrevibacter cuticularis TaxID=47311 RepID=A0A166E860_9EURY|nr:flippase [Methanobrevibacter cuticularis]KZX16380.1 putative cell division protein YtgP [Methanobrevibacter cuticularis]